MGIGMAARIEDYGVIGNGATVALVGLDGGMDWLCLPRFDSAPCFAALLGTPENGRFLIAPAETVRRATRAYAGPTMILRTRMETETGAVELTDFMVRDRGSARVVRRVRGLAGRVPMRAELVVRFDSGSLVPWATRQADDTICFTAGPDRLILNATTPMRGEGLRTVGDFALCAGETVDFVLTWTPSTRTPPPCPHPAALQDRVDQAWRGWAARFRPPGVADEAVLRSLLTLKALTHHETGGIVAAGTTSLPEQLGGPRNWDYRFCWLRDATFTLLAMIRGGYLEEAGAWREWLLRAVAGSPDQVQIMYGVAGERQLLEWEVPWLSGYEGSKPVRMGNAAHGQTQHDIYGEVVNAMSVAREAGLAGERSGWMLGRTLLDHLEKIWREPDSGIWEVRGPPRHYVQSKAMCWVAFDRAVRAAERWGLEAPIERWRATRDAIHADICAHGFSARRNAFVQHYGADTLDASTLLLALVGFLPDHDPRIRGTIAAIERDLMGDGLVLRYEAGRDVDGLPGGEGAFLPCSFWLVDNYARQGRFDAAHALFQSLLALRNDLGLLSEEYDPRARRLVGNFPQALSHMALENSAYTLADSVR